jgi:hypothetical protein
MAQIKKIEIICMPCHKCEILLKKFESILDVLRRKYKIPIKCEIKHIYNKVEVIQEMNKYGFNTGQLPIVLINDALAFTGQIEGDNVIRMKFEEIMKW